MAGFFQDASQKTASADMRPASIEVEKQAANRSTSFYTEVMLLVVCLLMTLVVLVPFFSRAYNIGLEATAKTDAIVYAQDISAFYTSADDDAEFAALLEGYSYTESFEAAKASWHMTVSDGFDIALVSASNATAAGTMRSLSMTILKDGDAVYTLETFKYVSSRGGGVS